ncbi:hypothetical protein POTOM_004436 [Populus tomentosa]|uniref:Uncharacterized protein n=1 Tax=Populus tomentosa TaxID=118781 RepID=A0A8X8AHB6_POPTO|nr:hypothetical protein POTOM_004436 [Populus tomentosa]
MDPFQVTTDLVKFSNPANILQRDFIVGAIYEDRNQTVLNSMINSELSLAAGSLPTGANSAVLKATTKSGLCPSASSSYKRGLATSPICAFFQWQWMFMQANAIRVSSAAMTTCE